MADSPKETKTPWRDGFWSSNKLPSLVLIVDGEKIEGKNIVAMDFPDIEVRGNPCTLKFGDFGPARKEVAEATGADNYNLERTIAKVIKTYGVINESGTEVTSWGFTNELEVMRWLSPKELQKLRDKRDDFNAPSCPHITPTPDKKGRIFWLSGPPGTGKSTTCQLMARKNGYVYYEADATMGLINPFIDLNTENPSLATMKGKPMRGVSREDAEIALSLARVQEENLKDGFSNYDVKRRPFLKVICPHLAKQKKRLGGDFAVAHAVSHRSNRDLCRELLGHENVIFLVMNLTKSCQKKRLEARHGGDGGKEWAGWLSKMFDLFEPAGEGEEGAYNVTVTESMSPDDVLKQVMDTISKI